MRDQILARIYERSPRQHKKIGPFLSQCPEAMRELDSFIEQWSGYLLTAGSDWDEVADAYVFMVNQMVHSRVQFARTGRYPSTSRVKAIEDVYENPEVMPKYLLGLALSQFLWLHHFECYQFFRRQISRLGAVERALEVGSGHGLFLIRMLQAMPTCSVFDVVDISALAIEMCKTVIHSTVPERENSVRFLHSDIMEIESNDSYDFISCGEVLEHVECPLELLRKLRGLLTATGKLYLCSCANCPAVDHVYHFESIAHIRDTIRKADLEIEDECWFPSEQVSEHVLEKLKLDIQYAAILGKRN